jgi:hypothetical protein
MDDHHGDVAGEGGEWIVIGEASRRLGVTRAAIYGRIQRGTLKTRPKGNRGLEVLWLPERQGNGRGNGKGDETAMVMGDVTRDNGGDIAMLLAELRDVLVRTRDERDQACAEAAELRSELTNLKVELATARAEREAARAVAIADVATAQTEAAAKDLLIAELRAELAHERDRVRHRPWWRRLFGS